MWRIQSTCLRLALAFLFFSSALGATKAPSEYRFETLAGGACARTGEPARVEVSLAELERLARDRHENGRSTSDLTLGGMTTLEAVRWDRVRREIMLEGLAGECEVEPIPLDAFVEALRIAEASSMWMSLEPERQGREVRHRVEFFPPGLANTHLLASMTKADYFLKALLLRAVDTPFEELPSVQGILDCRAPDQIEPAIYRHESRNVFIFGLPPALTLSADGKTVHLKPPRLVLRYGSSPSLLTREFSRVFNQRYSKIEQTHPRVFRGIRNTFTLYHVADLLKQWARDYDFSYWLSQYPLQAYPVPSALPAPVPRKVARFCGSPGEGVYTLEKTLAGGAVTEARFDWGFPDTGPGVAGVFSDGERVLVLERSGKASLVAGDKSRSGSYTRSSGTVRVVVGDEVLDLHLTDAGDLEDSAGGRWIPWLSLEDDIRAPLATEAARTEKSPPPENGGRESGASSSGAETKPPLPDTPLSDPSPGSPQWVRAPFREVSQVRAVSPFRSPLLAGDSGGDTCPDPDLLRLLQSGDLRQAAETLSRPAPPAPEGAVPCAHPQRNAFLRLWGLAEIRARLGDLQGAAKAAQLADQADQTAGASSDTPAFLEQSGSYYQSAGKYALALERYESCRDRLETAGRKKDPQTLRCLVRIAGLYSETYDFKRAETFFQAARAAASGISDIDALDLFAETLGWHYTRRGSFAQALKIFQHRLERLQSSQTQDPVALGEALAAVARCRFELYEVDEAKKLLLSALQRLEDSKLAYHPVYGWILNDLAAIEMSATNSKDLTPKLQAAFDLARQTYGIDHPNTLTVMNNLALAYSKMGKLHQAVRLLDQALSLLEKAAWEDFGLQSRLIRNRAIEAYLLGREEFAHSEMERAVLISRHALGERNPDTVQAVAELAQLEGLLGNRAKANELWVQSVSLRDSSSDPAFATLRLRLQALKTLAQTSENPK